MSFLVYVVRHVMLSFPPDAYQVFSLDVPGAEQGKLAEAEPA